MSAVNYHNRHFKMVSTSTGDDAAVSGTTFHYRQENGVVWGTYSGGTVAYGTLVARILDNGDLDLRFQHIYTDGRIMTGRSDSRLTILDDGRYRLDEYFQGEDASPGYSVVEEFVL